jgi:hypothetical protein
MDKLYTNHLKDWSKKKNQSENEIAKQSVVFFGTSRSAEYTNLKENFFNGNPYIKDPSLKEIPITALTVRAAPFLHIYKIYSHFIQNHTTPRLIILEINTITFNKNNVFKEKKDIYDFSWQDFKENFWNFSLKDRIEYISCLLFVLNKSNINWKKLLKGDKSENDVNSQLDLVMNLKKIMEAKQNYNSSWELGFREGTETKEMEKTNHEYNQWVINSFYQNYQTDETSFNLFVKILQEAKLKKIPLVLYRPRTHQSLKEDTKFIAKKEKLILDKLTHLSKELDIPFIDLENDTDFNCNYYADTSHLSKTCFPLVLETILKKTKERY